jgi:hypothetical protein
MRYLLILLSVSLVSFQSQKPPRTATRKADDIDSIIAYKINSSISSDFDIDCIAVRNFSDEVKKFDLTRFKPRILNDLAAGKPTTENWSVDARAQIQIWHHSGKVDTVCTCNLMAVSLNGEVFTIPNRDIIYLLDSLYLDATQKQK